jgi:hypothetical protein
VRLPGAVVDSALAHRTRAARTAARRPMRRAPTRRIGHGSSPRGGGRSTARGAASTRGVAGSSDAGLPRLGTGGCWRWRQMPD